MVKVFITGQASGELGIMRTPSNDATLQPRNNDLDTSNESFSDRSRHCGIHILLSRSRLPNEAIRKKALKHLIEERVESGSD